MPLENVVVCICMPFENSEVYMNIQYGIKSQPTIHTLADVYSVHQHYLHIHLQTIVISTNIYEVKPHYFKRQTSKRFQNIFPFFSFKRIVLFINSRSIQVSSSALSSSSSSSLFNIFNIFSSLSKM